MSHESSQEHRSSTGVSIVQCCRDSFQNVVELLDDMFQRAAAAEEPEYMNWIRAHAQALQQDGQDASAAAARLFSNPAGDYGSMVNERVGASNWSNSKVCICTAAGLDALVLISAEVVVVDITLPNI